MIISILTQFSRFWLTVPCEEMLTSFYSWSQSRDSLVRHDIGVLKVNNPHFFNCHFYLYVLFFSFLSKWCCKFLKYRTRTLTTLTSISLLTLTANSAFGKGYYLCIFLQTCCCFTSGDAWHKFPLDSGIFSAINFFSSSNPGQHGIIWLIKRTATFSRLPLSHQTTQNYC